MSDSDSAKAAKKTAKAQAKAEKKRAKAEAAKAGVGTAAAAEQSKQADGKRSADVAQRQVRLQSYRVWIALVTLLVALLTFLLTVRPWEMEQQGDIPADTTGTERSDE